MADISPQAIAIRDAVTEHYLDTRQPCDAPTLAQRLGWSVSKVRRIIADECHGAADGTCAEQEYRPSHSRNYPSMGPVGQHKVWVYYPTLWRLRELLLACREPVTVCGPHKQCPYHASGGPKTIACGTDTYTGHGHGQA